MRNVIIAATAAFGLASVALIGPANAQSQCYWSGYGWSCPQTYYAPGYYGHNGYPAYSYYPEPVYGAPVQQYYPGPKPGGGR